MSRRVAVEPASWARRAVAEADLGGNALATLVAVMWPLAAGVYGPGFIIQGFTSGPRWAALIGAAILLLLGGPFLWAVRVRLTSPTSPLLWTVVNNWRQLPEDLQTVALPALRTCYEADPAGPVFHARADAINALLVEYRRRGFDSADLDAINAQIRAMQDMRELEGRT